MELCLNVLVYGTGKLDKVEPKRINTNNTCQGVRDVMFHLRHAIASFESL